MPIVAFVPGCTTAVELGFGRGRKGMVKRMTCCLEPKAKDPT